MDTVTRIVLEKSLGLGGVMAPVSVAASSGTATIAKVVGGKRYVVGTPVSTLNITAVENSSRESEVVFEADSTITVNLPDTIGIVGDLPSFSGGESYVLNFRNGMLAAATYTPGA